MKKGILGAFALMAMTAGVTAERTAGFNEVANKVQNVLPRHSKTEAVAKEIKTSETVRNHRSYASSTFSNEGIPPKVYGMHYVKRGTHKRTNV